MRSSFKKTIAILLSVVLAFSVMTVGVVGASAEDGKLQVTVSSSVPEFFPTSTQSVDSSAGKLTVTYWFNIQDYMMVNNQWQLSYNPLVLRYNTDEGVNQTVSNNKTTYLVYKFPEYKLGSMEFNPVCEQDGVMKGNITNANGFECYGQKYPFLSITFDIIDNTASETSVYLDMQVMQVRHKDILPEETPVDFINHSKIENSDVLFTTDTTYTAAYEGEYNPDYSAEPIYNENLKFDGYTLELDSSINLIFYVLPSTVADYDEYWVEVTRESLNGPVTTKVQGSEASGEYIFRYPDILPQFYNDDYTAVIHCVKDGQEYYGVDYVRSVRYFIGRQIAKTTDAKYLALLTDLAVFGAEAQKITNYKVDNLVTAGLEDSIEQYASKTIVTEDIRDYAYRTTESPVMTWKGPSISLNGPISIMPYFKLNEGQTIEGKKMKVEIGNRVIEYTDFTYDANYGEWTFECDALFADQIDTPVYFTLYDENDQVCSDTMRYSVSSYADRYLKNHPDGEYAPLVTAMMKYGLSSKAYRNP